MLSNILLGVYCLKIGIPTKAFGNDRNGLSMNLLERRLMVLNLIDAILEGVVWKRV
ncbi:MAG: hypothetical protein ACI8V2_003391 [Candidatus Latescibacterota bacterium]|jgi:hypothetical protein